MATTQSPISVPSEPKAKTKIPIVLGAMTFGKPGVMQARVTSLQDVSSMITLFQSHGHSEIDTARIYGMGSSEEYLGSLEPSYSSRGITMATKLYPNDMMGVKITHSAVDLRVHLERSLKALGVEKVDIFYLHAPDRKTEFEETLRACDELYREGKFERLGVSNFMAWEVARVQEICIRNGWIGPSIYQGIYNTLQRSIEPELLPCLHHYNMSLYAFNPIAGGYLTSRYHRSQEVVEKGARFNDSDIQGKMYRMRYWNDTMFDALDIIREACHKEGLTESEVALRWMVHHSGLEAGRGDRIIVGASSRGHLEENLKDLEKGPLGEEVVEALDRAWGVTRKVVTPYFH